MYSHLSAEINTNTDYNLLINNLFVLMLKILFLVNQSLFKSKTIRLKNIVRFDRYHILFIYRYEPRDKVMNFQIELMSNLV